MSGSLSIRVRRPVRTTGWSSTTITRMRPSVMLLLRSLRHAARCERLESYPNLHPRSAAGRALDIEPPADLAGALVHPGETEVSIGDGPPRIEPAPFVVDSQDE